MASLLRVSFCHVLKLLLDPLRQIDEDRLWPPQMQIADCTGVRDNESEYPFKIRSRNAALLVHFPNFGEGLRVIPIDGRVPAGPDIVIDCAVDEVCILKGVIKIAQELHADHAGDDLE